MRSTSHVDAILAVQSALHVPRGRATGGPVRSTGGPVRNTGGPVRNTGGPVRDTGGPVRDTGGPVRDTGGPVRDTGGPVRDTGGPVRDTGGPVFAPRPTWTRYWRSSTQYWRSSARHWRASLRFTSRVDAILAVLPPSTCHVDAAPNAQPHCKLNVPRFTNRPSPFFPLYCPFSTTTRPCESTCDGAPTTSRPSNGE